MERFTFQQQDVEQAKGLVLNVGCNEDPAGLKGYGNVINCDIRDTDPISGLPYAVDRIFDCGKDIWPFEDDTAELIILGDIVEHLTVSDFRHCLGEARRVGERLNITVPEDHRIFEAGYEDEVKRQPKGLIHVTLVTRKYLEDELAFSGWNITNLLEINYGFVERGFLVSAERSWPAECNKCGRVAGAICCQDAGHEGDA